MNFSTGVDAAIEHFGSVNQFAKEVSRTRATIWHWRKCGIPVKIAINLNTKSKGQLSLQTLRPDVWDKNENET